MVPTDWTPAGFAGIARHEAAGRFVLDLAPGPRPRRTPPTPTDVDIELLACAQRVIAHTAAHYRRTGWMAESGRHKPCLAGHPARLTPRASRSGECLHPINTRQEHAK
jgi:hypothetical protein